MMRLLTKIRRPVVMSASNVNADVTPKIVGPMLTSGGGGIPDAGTAILYHEKMGVQFRPKVWKRLYSLLSGGRKYLADDRKQDPFLRKSQAERTATVPNTSSKSRMPNGNSKAGFDKGCANMCKPQKTSTADSMSISRRSPKVDGRHVSPRGNNQGRSKLRRRPELRLLAGDAEEVAALQVCRVIMAWINAGKCGTRGRTPRPFKIDQMTYRPDCEYIHDN